MIESYGILGWIVIGLLAGAIAKLLMPGKGPGRLHHHHPARHRRRPAGRLPGQDRSAGMTRDEAAGFIAAIVGAFLLLLIYRLVLRRR